MLQRFVYILIFLMGVFLYPSNASACQKSENETAMSCCTKKKAASDTKEDCCKEETKQANKSSKEDCEQDASCHCPSVKTPIYVLAFSTGELLAAQPQATAYASRPTHIPQSGFVHIWLLPKIA